MFHQQCPGNLGKYLIKWKLAQHLSSCSSRFTLTQVCLPEWEQWWIKAQTPDSCVSLDEGEGVVLWRVPPGLILLKKKKKERRAVIMRLQQICVYNFSAATCIRRRKNSVMRFPHATSERPKGKGLNAKPILQLKHKQHDSNTKSSREITFTFTEQLHEL